MARAAAALLLALALAWGAALWVGFLYDDLADVVGNPAGQAATFWENLGATLRPLLKASYALQDWLHGPWAPGFHAGNLLLHLATALVALCWLTRLAGRRVALVTVALWALHPALANSVTEVAGRSAVLSGLLTLGCLALATGPTSRPRLLLAGLLAFLAPLARETALVLPPLLLWWQATLGDGSWRRAWPVWLGTLLAAAAILALPRHRELIDYSLAARGPLDALRGNLVAIPAILRFLVEPWAVSIDPAQPRPWGWGDGPTLLSLAGLLGVALAALLLRRRAPLVAFALGWTLLCLLPSNSLLWREEPVGLRPLYLAGLGPALLLALLLAQWRAGLAGAALVCLVLGALTLERNRLYADPVALWQDAADKAPGKARPRVQLGLALLEHGCLDRASAALAEGLRLDPGSRAARQGLERLAALGAEVPPPTCDLP